MENRRWQLRLKKTNRNRRRVKRMRMAEMKANIQARIIMRAMMKTWKP
jgi:hypothetical protein